MCDAAGIAFISPKTSCRLGPVILSASEGGVLSVTDKSETRNVTPGSDVTQAGQALGPISRYCTIEHHRGDRNGRK